MHTAGRQAERPPHTRVCSFSALGPLWDGHPVDPLKMLSDDACPPSL